METLAVYRRRLVMLADVAIGGDRGFLIRFVVSSLLLALLVSMLKNRGAFLYGQET